MVSVIIPACNEERYIGRSLEALLASAPIGAGAGEHGAPVEIVVVANGCTDDTAGAARRYGPAAAERGWRLTIIEVAQGGKLNALNAGDAAAGGDMRVYLDADVLVSPDLLGQLCAALDTTGPAYASGRPAIPRGESWITRAYARVWKRVPFMTDGVPGSGVFAVNAAGRARWAAFPEIISDDTYVRLQFAPEERIGVAATYDFPMVEGFVRLVRVRRRQDVGVREVARKYPELMRNDDKPRFGVGRALRIAASDPIGLCIYCAVALAVRLRPDRKGQAWSRGR